MLGCEDGKERAATTHLKLEQFGPCYVGMVYDPCIVVVVITGRIEAVLTLVLLIVMVMVMMRDPWGARPSFASTSAKPSEDLLRRFVCIV